MRQYANVAEIKVAPQASPKPTQFFVLLLIAFGTAIRLSASSALPTTTALAVSASTVPAGTKVVFTATVKDQNNTPVTKGQVNFCNASATYCEDVAIFGAAQLTSSGVATLNLRLGIGSHSIKAVFLGTVSDATSTSAIQPVTVTGQVWDATALTISGVPGNYTLDGESQHLQAW